MAVDDVQRVGGIAALVEAVAYLLGFALFIGVLDSSAYVGDLRKVAFLVDHRIAMFAGAVLIYMVTGAGLVALTSALHQRLTLHSRSLMLFATPFGFIWAGLIIASGMVFIVGMEAVVALHRVDADRAASLWIAVGVVQNALGGGIEFVGGIWVMLVSWAARRSENMPQWLCPFGLVVGGAGILTVFPPLAVMTDIFGLAMIVWFACLGLVMIQEGGSRSAPL